MACPTEWSWMLYVDGELAQTDSREAARHLETCGACRELVAALEEENHLLVHTLQGRTALRKERAVATATVSKGRPANAVRLGVYTAGVAVAMRLGLGLLVGFQFPVGLDWLNPLRPLAQLNLFVSTLLYFVREGSMTMGTMLSNGNLVAFYGLGLFALVVSLRRLSRSTVMLGMTVILAFPVSGFALDIRSGELVVLAAGETLDDTLLIRGDVVRIEGTVTGDVIAFGRVVEVRGTVEGNLFAGAQVIVLSGNVGGSVLGSAQTIRMSGQATRNLYGLAQSIAVESTGRVGGDTIMLGADGSLDGQVQGGVTMFGGRLGIAADIGQNVLFRGGVVALQSPANVSGNLTAYVEAENDVRIDPGATVVGQTNIELAEPERSPYTTFSFYLGQAIRIAAAFVTGLLLFWLFPGLSRVSLDSARALLMAGGLGFLTVIAVPIGAIVLAITLVGLPIAITGIGVWLVGLYLSKIVVAQFLGRSLLRGRDGRMSQIAVELLAGLVLVFVAVNLPYIGGLLSVLLILLGLGILVLRSYRTSKWWFTSVGEAEHLR